MSIEKCAHLPTFVYLLTTYSYVIISWQQLSREVVVAQVVEKLLLIPEVSGFVSSHRQNFIEHLFNINYIEKTKINKERPGMAHFF